MKLSYRHIFTILCLVQIPTQSFGVTLPSRMPSFVKTSDSVDLGLASWLRQHADVKPVTELNVQEFMKKISSYSPAEQALLTLSRGRQQSIRPKKIGSQKRSSNSEKQFDDLFKKTLKDIQGIIESELKNNGKQPSVIVQQLYQIWEELDPTTARASELKSRIFFASDSTTCAAKAVVLDGISKDTILAMTSEELANLMRRSSQFQSVRYRRTFIESIIAAMSDEKKAELSPIIRDIAKENPAIYQRFPELKDGEQTDVPPDLIFAETSRALRRKQCQAAESAFRKTLEMSKSSFDSMLALDIGSDVERCYRAERRSSSKEFWARVTPTLERRFGKIGLLWVKVRLGYLKWVSDDLPEATSLLNEVLSEVSKSTEYRPIRAKVIYYLAKVSEDQNDITSANRFFDEYVKKYSDLEDFELALTALTVNRASQLKWAEVAAPLEAYLAEQSLLHIDRRPIGLMAFSLFWLGRAKLEAGEKDMASELWRRLAAEYYSTFYGAMGHYLLEQTSGRSYAIEPARTTGFDFSALTRSLSPPAREAANRAQIFLRLGLPEVARCEADEVGIPSSEDHDALLVRTLLLHASGAWLDAIKIYDSIPRSIRNALPVGFEKVLFPRKYETIVKTKSEKLGVDPDFVFALMRQESVFAKDAKSPVGATGLMQLMPSTARLELGKLSDNYVDSVRRSQLQQLLASDNSLRDPEVNVTLGVHHLWRLMQIYKSPVFALTAYNASPSATAKWQKSIASDDWLTFIERIPYKETRAYVKLIMRNYFYYKRWYNSPDTRRQEHIDILVDGVISLAKEQASSESAKPDNNN